MKKLWFFLILLVPILSFFSCAPNNANGANKASFDAGNIENANYINNWLNIKITPTEEWKLLPQDQLEKIYSGAQNTVIGLGNDKKEAFNQKESLGLYPLGYVHTKTNSNILLAFEKLKSSNESESINVYIDSIKSQLKQLEPQGMVYTISEPKNTKIGQLDCTQITATTDFQGKKITQNYYLKSKDGYMFAISTSSASDEGNAAIDKLIANITNSN